MILRMGKSSFYLVTVTGRFHQTLWRSEGGNLWPLTIHGNCARCAGEIIHICFFPQARSNEKTNVNDVS